MESKNKKVLIVSSSIGAGHTQAAIAIKAAWEMQFPVDQVHIVDFMDSDNSYLNYLVKETYLKMIMVSPDMYKTLYCWTQGSHGMKVQNLLSWIMQKSMEKLICQYRPDVIICTHPFPCGAAAYLKRKQKINIPIVGIVTDFMAHQLWIYPEIDQYVVATPEMKDKLIEQGISPRCIRTTGIPIHPRFSLFTEADHLPNLLDLDKNQPILLLMGGGLGLGPMRELLMNLNCISFPLQIIAVTGRNVELREDLEVMAAQSRHTMHVLGHTHHIRELMQVSNILITKPGALTISEALAMELPMLFFEPIPGQEMDNATYIVNKGAARWITNCKASLLENGGELESQISNLCRNKSELAVMRAAAKLICKPQSAWDAVMIISQLANEHLQASNSVRPFKIGGKYSLVNSKKQIHAEYGWES
jgi:processive 1,2-diacylglycerol beta-glucosyltransferase